MRILFLQFPLEPAFGGAEVQTSLLAEGLQEAGHNVRIVSSNEALSGHLQDRKIQTNRLWVGFEPTSLWSLFLFPITFIISVIQFTILQFTIRPHVVFCLSLTDKLIATPLAKLFGAKVLWIEHTRLGRWFYKNPLLHWYRLMSKLVKIVVQSNFLKDQLIAGKVNPDSITVIYPTIPLSHLGEGVPSDSRVAGEAGISEWRLTLGFLGRLASEKGVEVLLRALKEFPTAHIRIAGTGPDESKLKKLTIDLGIENRVEFLGFVNDKNNFFQSVDTLVVPSIQAESFGLVIVEAMAAGIPVIASRIGAIPEIIENKKTGLLFEPGNIDELIEAIKLFQSNLSLRKSLVDEARQSIQSGFNADKMIENYLTLL